MPDMIPDLWPDDVTVSTVLTPVSILRFQAEKLRERTHGLLEAEVQSSIGEDGRMYHSFDLIAPALHRYRYRLFAVDHDEQMVYPVHVDFQEDRAELYTPLASPFGEIKGEATQDGFLKRIGEILQSSRVRSVIHSLIARINEAKSRTPSS